MEMSGQLHAPAALSRYSLDRRMGGPQAGLYAVERRMKISSPPGNRTLVVQPVAYSL